MPAWLKNWLKVRFVAGFFVTVPAIATAWLLWIFWSSIDDFFAPLYAHIFGRPILGLGFLTKRPVAVLLPGLGMLLLAWQRRRRGLPVTPAGFALALLAFGTFGLGWFAALYARLQALGKIDRASEPAS